MNYQKALDQYKEILGHTEVDSVARLKFLVSLLDEEEEEPWYPDDSGEWIEHTPGEDPGLDPDQVVFVLFRDERNEKKYCHIELYAGDFVFAPCPGEPESEIVAYKLAK